MKHLKQLTTILSIIFLSLILTGCQKTDKITQEDCGIENCHGLEIVCGSNMPEACTEIYKLGDFCREYAKCEIVDNKCQLQENPKFTQCKSCVEKCEALGGLAAEQCEYNCRKLFVKQDESQLPNPAAVYCLEQGGELEDRQNAKGIYSVCKFSDGSECEEWALFKKECEKGDSLESENNEVKTILNQETGLKELEIDIYFGDNKAISETACFKTLAKKRKIVYTQDIKNKAVSAIQELLKGPTQEEKQEVSLAVPAGTKLLSLEIKDKIAFVDFSEELQSYGGGSCMALAIKSQIENTLKQFEEIEQIAITIEGYSAGVIEP